MAGRAFDVVLACDNSLPNLLADAEILSALEQFHRCTAPGGLCLVSVRDYARERRDRVQVRPPVLHQKDGGRAVVLQVWEFDGAVYDMSLYVVEDEQGSGPRTHVFRSRYYAVALEVLARLLRQAGFEVVERLDEPFYQPVLLGRR